MKKVIIRQNKSVVEADNCKIDSDKVAQTLSVKTSEPEMIRNAAKSETINPETAGSKFAQAVLDGFNNQKALLTVLNRVSLASLTYAAGSSMFIYALLTAFDVHMYGWGPLHAALANVVFVVYFTTIMVPFAMMLSWVFRYKQSLPYQTHFVELDVPSKDAYELALGAALSITGSTLKHADEKSGVIRCSAPRRKEAAAQDIDVQIIESLNGRSKLSVSSKPELNAVEDLLFGFTLAIDGGRNKSNVDQIVSFLNEGKLALQRSIAVELN